MKHDYVHYQNDLPVHLNPQVHNHVLQFPFAILHWGWLRVDFVYLTGFSISFLAPWSFVEVARWSGLRGGR